MIAVFLHNIMLLPVILPLICAAALLLIDEKLRLLKALLALAAAGLLIIIAAMLVYHAQDISPSADVYNLGNWGAPFGIVFVTDRLTAIFLLMAAVIVFCALIYATAYWDKAGAHFYSFTQFFLAGVNGAFLTGDIFNLFVFFEVILAASYALLMHAPSLARVRAGAHYVIVNLTASFFFLVGAACIYGSAGTLNMADLASKLIQMQGQNLLICHIGMGILGLAFLIKAGIWPLCFWVPAGYGAACPPVGAMFSVTSKVGLYAVLRLMLLLLENDVTGLAPAAGNILFYGGIITVLFGLFGVLAAQNLARLAANSTLISTGTALTAIGLAQPALISIALYYILSSTLALAAFFLLAEPAERGQDAAANVLAITLEVYGDDEEEEEEELGFYIPATLAVLGACFAFCAIMLIGLPPLAGFLAKFMMIAGIFRPQGMGAPQSLPDMQAWLFIAALLLAGFAQLIAMTRSGIRIFWTRIDAQIPKVQIAEIVPIAALLGCCLTLSLAANPVMYYLDSLSAELRVSANYIHSVLGGAVESGE